MVKIFSEEDIFDNFLSCFFFEKLFVSLSVWFNGDPRGDMGSLSVVVDGERFDRVGRCYPLTAAEIDALTNGPWSASNWGVFNG